MADIHDSFRMHLVESLLVLLLVPHAAFEELRYLLCNTVSFSVVTCVFALFIDQVLQYATLLQQEVHQIDLFQLDELNKQRVAICIDMVDVSSSLDQTFSELVVETFVIVVGQKNVHQDSHAVLVLLVDRV